MVVTPEPNKLNISDLPNPHDLNKPLDVTLWALLALKDVAGGDEYRSADDIRKYLLSREISLSKIKIERALARAGNKVDRSRDGGTTRYLLMQPGRTYLNKLVSGDSVNVLYIDGSKPSSSRISVKDLFKNFKGNIFAVDQYFGIESIDMIHALAVRGPLKFLTSRITRGHEAQLKAEVIRLKKEFGRLEIRQFQNIGELHDRYVVDDNSFCFIGHGLKDVGTKESFVLVLRDPAGREIRTTLKDKFLIRWQNAIPI